MPALPLLRCFGQFQLALNEQSIALSTRKTATLLVYLVLHSKPHGREPLAALFWGDSGDEEARRSLRNALSALRKALGETALLSDQETVQFNPDYALTVDAVDFRTQAQRFLAAPAPTPALIDITLYRGDLLEGFYDDWILREREALRQLYLQVLLRLAQQWRTQGDYPLSCLKPAFASMLSIYHPIHLFGNGLPIWKFSAIYCVAPLSLTSTCAVSNLVTI